MTEMLYYTSAFESALELKPDDQETIQIVDHITTYETIADHIDSSNWEEANDLIENLLKEDINELLQTAVTKQKEVVQEELLLIEQVEEALNPLKHLSPMKNSKKLRRLLSN